MGEFTVDPVFPKGSQPGGKNMSNLEVQFLVACYPIIAWGDVSGANIESPTCAHQICASPSAVKRLKEPGKMPMVAAGRNLPSHGRTWSPP